MGWLVAGSFIGGMFAMFSLFAWIFPDVHRRCGRCQACKIAERNRCELHPEIRDDRGCD